MSEGVDPTLVGQKQIIAEDAHFMIGRYVRGLAHALTLAPKVPEVVVTFAENIGFALAVTPTGTTVAVTYDPTVSTVAQFKAAVAGDPAALALLAVAGTDADVFPVLTSLSASTFTLYTTRKASPVSMFVRDADTGALIPMTTENLKVVLEGVKIDHANIEVQTEAIPDDAGEKPDSMIVYGSEDGTEGPTKVHPLRTRTNGTLVKDLDNWDDGVTVSLVGARAAPGTEITDALAHSLSGRSLVVASCGGTAVIKLNFPSTTLTSLLAAQYGTIAIDVAGKTFTRTVGSWKSDVGGTKANGYPLNYAAAGTKITIGGTDHNNGTYTVVSVDGTGLILTVSEALVGPNEAASALVTVAGYRPKAGVTVSPLMWPAMIQIEEEFTKVYVENTAQLGVSMVLSIGDKV